MSDAIMVDRQKKINWNFIAHVIRDVFEKPITPAAFTQDPEAMGVFRSSLHSLGFLLYNLNSWGDPIKYNPGTCYVTWDFKSRPPVYKYHDMILIFNNNEPKFNEIRGGLLAFHLNMITKSGSPIIVANSPFVDPLPLPIDIKKTEELKRYHSVFREGEVVVYENL